MSHAEYLRWIAFASHEPLGAARDDLRSAMQMMLTVAVNRRKRDKKPRLEQFLPDWWDDRKRPENLAAKFRALMPSDMSRDGMNEQDESEATDERP